MTDNTAHQAVHFPSPLGEMAAVFSTAGVLLRLDFLPEGQDIPSSWHGASLTGHTDTTPGAAALTVQLDEYFAGARQAFDLPLAPQGGDFLQRAWAQLRQVPYGTTLSYGELARRLTPQSSPRALGRANAVNPISIIIPCHRIIASTGALTGYAGGLHRKQALLALEARHVERVDLFSDLPRP